MRASASFKWIGLALLGVAVAAAVAVAASNLASRQIGLASEPITAGEALAPAASPDRAHRPSHSTRGHGDSNPVPATPTTTTTTAPPPEEPPPTTTVETPPPEDGDDHGGGHGSGHGADD